MEYTRITGSFSGSGALINNLTASGISNFTNDVRAQFSAGTNITINNGVISASAGGGGGSGTINTGSAGFVTYYPSAGTTVDDASGSTGGLYWDNANIRLGVNTTSPTYRLDVAGTGRFTSNVEVTGTVKSTGTIYSPGLILSNSSGYSSIELGAPSGAHIDLKRPETDDYDIRLISDNNIEGGGYLIASGGAILALSGSGVAVGQYSNAGYKFLVAGTTRLANTVEIGQNGYLSLYDNATQVVIQYPNKQVNFYNTTSGSSMLIDTNGNVGIATSTPATKLEISGAHVSQQGLLKLNSSIGSTAAMTFYPENVYAGAIFYDTDDKMFFGTQTAKSVNIYTSGTNNTRLTIDETGRVGIGTTDLGAKLTVIGSSSNDVVPEFRISGSNGKVDFYNSLDNNNYNSIVETGDKAIIFTEGTQDTGDFVIAPWVSTGTKGIRITSNGDVGIGVSAPSTTLHVNGNISGTYLAVSDKTTTAGQNEIYGKNIPKAWGKFRLSNPIVLADGYNFITNRYNWITTGQKIAISASNFTTTAMLTSASIQTSITYESSTALVAGTANAVPRVISATSDGTYGIITIDFINHTSSLLTMTSAPYSDAVPYLNVTIFTKM